MTRRPPFANVLAPATLLLAAIGCQSAERADSPPPPTAPLRALQVPIDAAPADADRAALARFVGVWNFEGRAGRDALPRSASGFAAGVIEDEHFILIDFQATSGELAGRAGRKGGSMLLASEPGLGITLTAWGDASPSISRFVGRAHHAGSSFAFHEAQTPENRHRLDLNITFTSDDRWTLEVRDTTAPGDPIVAFYQFTRAPQ